MKYNFDEVIERRNTDCLKYDAAKRIFGTDEAMPMWIADMDFRTPPFVVETLRRRLEHEILGYTFCSPKWKPAIQSWLSRRYGWAVEEGEIGFVSGIVPALAFVIDCFTSPGDKILIQPPVYHPYHHLVRDFEREAVHNSLVLKNGQYEIDFEGKTEAEIKLITEYLKYIEYLSKWNGELPEVMTGDGASIMVPVQPGN